MQVFVIFSMLGPLLLGLLIGYKGGWKVARGEFFIRLIALLFFGLVASMIAREVFVGLELTVVMYVIRVGTSTFLMVTIYARVNMTGLRPVWFYYLLACGLFVVSTFVILTGVPVISLFISMGTLALVGFFPNQKAEMPLSVQTAEQSENEIK